MAIETLFSGAGIITLHTRDVNGNPLGGLHIGDTDNMSLSGNTDTEEHIENQTGFGLTSGRLIKSTKLDVSMDMFNYSIDNLLLGWNASKTSVAASTVTNEVLPASITVGDKYLFTKQNVSSVVITDSTGSPKTLPAGQYTLNEKAGSIVINDKTTGGPYAEPFKASYAFGTSTQIALFTTPSPERWYRFEGVNKMDNFKTVILDLYKVKFDPFNGFNLISQSIQSFPLKGSALADTTKPRNGTLGQFGRIVDAG